MTTCDSGRIGLAALIVAGAWAGPVAGGQLVLLGKPFGGVLGIPGAVVGYVGLSALVLACATGALVARHDPTPRWGGVFAMVAGVSFATAGMVVSPVPFVISVLVAAIATGPLIVIARIQVWRYRTALTGWHVAMATGVTVGAGFAIQGDQKPGGVLVAAGIATMVHGAAAMWAKPLPAQPDSPFPGSPPARLPLGYATIGFVLGGTVLPALHLLLFRWDALTADQATLLLFAAIPAGLVVALPGPHADAIPILLLLAAAGPVLVATAPGPATAAIGIAVTLTAAARAARGLDLVAAADHRHRWGSPTITLSTVVAAGLAGLGLVTACDRAFGTGTALTLLALPIGIAALRYRRAVPIGGTRSAAAVVAALVFVAALTFAAPPGHAEDKPVLVVSASTELTEGQRITLDGSGFRPGLAAVAVGMCKQGFTNGLKDCDLEGGATFVNIAADGTFPTVTLTARPRFGDIDCARQQCVLAAAPLPGTEPQSIIDANSAQVPIGFAGSRLPVATATPTPVAGQADSETDGPSTALWSVTAALLFIVAVLAFADRRRL